MSCFKRVFVKILLVLALPSAQAGLIDLGVADKYSLAVGQYDFFGTPVGGNLNLGSEAWIYGSVAASTYIGFGSGAIVYGDACAPSMIGADVRGNAAECSDVIKPGVGQFDQLSLDIASANQQAAALGGFNFGAINSTIDIQANDYDALMVSELNLASDEYLTINGSVNDNIVLNILGNAFVGSGAGILLTGGLTSANVFFNFINDGQATFNFGGANISGTFLANNGAFIAGDGAKLDDVRFYTNNTLIANVQEVRTSTPVEVPEPSTILMLLVSLSVLLMARHYQHN